MACPVQWPAPRRALRLPAVTRKRTHTKNLAPVQLPALLGALRLPAMMTRRKHTKRHAPALHALQVDLS